MIGCAVIGAGQAGLATSYHLSQLAVDHVVLERGQVADTWRTARWDGFHLNTPNWATQLPGLPMPGDDPDAFAPRDEVIANLERYAALIEAPLREHADVTALRTARGGFELDVSGDTMKARSVVVASGAYQQPTRLQGCELPDAVLAMHTAAYRRPSQLPPGGVLIVGSGQSGCEIAQELLDDGRRVHMAVGRCPWFPRRYRGADLMRWMEDVGLMHQTIDQLPTPRARLSGNVTVSGARGGVDASPLVAEAAGAVLHGRLTGIAGGRALFADDLDASITWSLQFERELRARCDAYAEEAGLELPEHAPVFEGPEQRPAATELQLEEAGVTTVLWANGYRPSFGWIELPIIDELGFPRTQRGVTEVPGLAFVGLPWLYKRRSPLLIGVGDDAAHVATSISDNLRA
jgi:putative flavoprotein involved in K+ transport